MADTVLFDELERLLACAVDALTDAGAPVCRSFVHPGATAPDDYCGVDGDAEGQAWVNVERVVPSASFPAQDTSAQRCAPVGYAAQVRVGVVRCAATVEVNSDGTVVFPPGADVTADAAKTHRDRRLLLEAILCCFTDVDFDLQVGAWEPRGPSGGCVGGTWTVQLPEPACPCPD